MLALVSEVLSQDELMRVHHQLASEEQACARLEFSYQGVDQEVFVWKGMPVSVLLLIVRAMGDQGESEERLLVRSAMSQSKFWEGSAGAEFTQVRQAFCKPDSADQYCGRVVVGPASQYNCKQPAIKKAFKAPWVAEWKQPVVVVEGEDKSTGAVGSLPEEVQRMRAQAQTRDVPLRRRQTGPQTAASGAGPVTDSLGEIGGPKSRAASSLLNEQMGNLLEVKEATTPDQGMMEMDLPSPGFSIPAAALAVNPWQMNPLKRPMGDRSPGLSLGAGVRAARRAAKKEQVVQGPAQRRRGT